MSGLILNGSGSLTLAETGVDTFAGGITLDGTGMLLLDNNPASTISGGLLNSFGTVQLGNNDANGSLPSGNLTNNAALVFDRTDVVTVANPISGSGNLTNNGSGTVILTGANSYSGYTAINAGTVQVGNGGATGALGGNSIIDNGSLVFNLSSTITVTPDISGTGSLTKTGTGKVTLSTVNAHTGNTATDQRGHTGVGQRSPTRIHADHSGQQRYL